ncbi:MAG: FAD-dependent oxidoreductase [Trueperaceae bacterium]|nr:FAD-dependent oxidoreductase [Trueperaceae bacterium]
MPEANVAKLSDLRDGDMMQVSVGDTDVLLAKVAGQVYATGAYCTHYGAPLAEGALSGERVICPWHHACFHVGSGDQLEPPGLDSVSRFDVRIDGDHVFVSVPDDADNDRVLPAVRKQADDERVFVVLGGGPAGAYAAETLRQEGFSGRLVMISHEDYLPFDRTNLSKHLSMVAEPDELVLRGEDFYDQRDIERIRDVVREVDAGTQMIHFANGGADDGALHYDKLLVATGGVPKRLELPGMDLTNVFTLRHIGDAQQILNQAGDGVRAVVVGSSFIGTEVAMSLVKNGCGVTVVSPDSVPLENVLGDDLGTAVQNLHEQGGIGFRLGHKPARFEGDGAVERVVLDNGDVIEADLVVVGVGVRPATDMLKGVDLQPDGGVRVDAHMHAQQNLYAAGDIASFPHRDGFVRIEHWRVAAQHGRVAAKRMLGQDARYDGVPFFWSEQPGMQLGYVGFAPDWDEVIIDGDPEEADFLACFVKDNEVLAAAASGRDSDLAAIEHLMQQNRMPSAAEVRQGNVDWAGLL